MGRIFCGDFWGPVLILHGVLVKDVEGVGHK